MALWPQPDIRWPTGIRVYPEAAEERVSVKDGRLAGAKVFHFLLLADSAGTLAIPAVRYAYFNPVEGRYQLTEGAPVSVVVAPGGGHSASRAEPPPIRLNRRHPVALQLRRTLPAAAWWIVLALPVFGLVVQRWPRRRPPVSAEVKARRGDSLAAAERRLETALRGFAGARLDRADGSLAQSLRQAGLAAPVAEELATLWDQVRLARYSPVAMTAPEALARQVDGALGRLQGEAAPDQPRWRRRTGLLLCCLLAGSGARLDAQTPPEQLYEAGAYSGAAQGFLRLVTADPDAPALWFNLGAAAYRAGDDGLALAAWTRGARLAPRDAGLRRALLLVPPADAAAAHWLWVAPLAPSEVWLIGVICWLVAWAGILWTRRFQGRWLVLLVGGGLVLALGVGLGRWYRDATAVVNNNTVLRLSPHELAPAVGEVAKLGAVRVDIMRAGWWRVEAPGGQIGWIRESDLAPVIIPAQS